jgi:hypothetical protein
MMSASVRFERIGASEIGVNSSRFGASAALDDRPDDVGKRSELLDGDELR